MAEEAKEKEMIEELNFLIAQREKAEPSQKEFYNRAINTLIEKVKVLNKQVPGILDRLIKKLEMPKKEPSMSAMPARPAMPVTPAIPVMPAISAKAAKRVRISTVSGIVTISKKDKKRFLEDIRVESEALKKIKKTIKVNKKKKKEKPAEATYKKISPFAALSSRLFSSISLKIAKNFAGLHRSLRKANMPFLISSYISIMLFSVLIALIAGIIGSVTITFFSSPQNLLVVLARNVSVSLSLPLLTFIIFYAYPSSQAASIKGRIENELPFAAMHMATISGAGVEPSRIFKIIALGKEYPYTSREATKIINEVNFYGYDLVTALRETAKTTSSENLSDLLNGMATTIASGGDLRSYLNESSASLLHDYKLKRESYVEVSGTYGDVYTGLLIAAPLIFMLMLALINVIGVKVSTLSLGIIGIGAIIALNIGFIIFLQISQPSG